MSASEEMRPCCDRPADLTLTAFTISNCITRASGLIQDRTLTCFHPSHEQGLPLCEGWQVPDRGGRSLQEAAGQQQGYKEGRASGGEVVYTRLGGRAGRHSIPVNQPTLGITPAAVTAAPTTTWRGRRCLGTRSTCKRPAARGGTPRKVGAKPGRRSVVPAQLAASARIPGAGRTAALPQTRPPTPPHPPTLPPTVPRQTGQGEQPAWEQ